jgi:hypothetical protein
MSLWNAFPSTTGHERTGNSPNLTNVKPAGVVRRGSWDTIGAGGRQLGELQILV